MEEGAVSGTEYAGMAEELAGLIRRAYGARYNAELTAREQEWALQRYDLQQKYQAWTEAAQLILERGRLDWQEGGRRMEESYGSWLADFGQEYRRVSEAWEGAYLAGLEDKAAWVELATDAANHAASGALLAMVGSEAERGARAMDAWTPLGMPAFTGAEEAGALLGQVLASSGIVNLEDAAGGIRGAAGTVSRQVRRGAGGLRVWDAGLIQVTAASLARNAHEELAAREVKRVAANVQTMVQEVLDQFYANVEAANKDFRENMDEVFIMEGQWRRSGTNYTKNAIVHSTLVDPVITESVSVEGYRDYVMDPVTLSTDLGENRLKDLDALGIEALLRNMYAEIEALTEEVFGKGDEDAGRFGGHIGKSPEVKEKGIDIDQGKDALFSDPGSGELGRLLRDYIYWTIRESNGISSINAAFWEKPLWDSRGSWFQAPTIRSVVDIGMQAAVSALSFTGVGAVAAIAINAGLNLVDDLAFGLMDAAGGYKTWDEAGFEFGRKAVMSAAGAASGAVLNGVNGLAGSSLFARGGLTGLATEGLGLSGVSGVLAGAGMSGISSLTTGTITSALSGVSYNSRDGWGYDGGAFFDSWKDAGISSLTGMTSSAIGGMMNRGLEGFSGKLYTDGAKLSALTGDLAAQGLNYAFNDDFALNLVNLDAVTGGKVRTGLLELHLGSSGVSMGLGTGGADLSALALIGAFRGLEAWAVNTRLLTTDSSDARRRTSQMRTLYSGDQAGRDEFEAVLAGKTRYVENRNAEGTESVYNEYTGVKTVILGRDALEEGSRFGLNVLFSHEAYRNGRDDGEEGQIAERDRAVEGHINTALGILNTYGAGSIGAGLQGEALWYDYARSMENGALTGAVRNAYDTSRDFWQLTAGGGLTYDGNGYLRDVDGLFINYDGTKTTEIRENTVGSKGIETVLIRILDLAATPENTALVQDMMIRSGLRHIAALQDKNDREKWMWNGMATEENMGIVINQRELSQFGMLYLNEFNLPLALVGQALRIQEISQRVSERPDLQPVMENGKAVTTFCNFNFIDSLKGFSKDEALIKGVTKAGIANEIGLYLQQEYKGLDSGLRAQILANMGVPVAISYINPRYDTINKGNNNEAHGHIATVTANYGTYIPALGPRISAGSVPS
jgi:hypothetical protein